MTTHTRPAGRAAIAPGRLPDRIDPEDTMNNPQPTCRTCVTPIGRIESPTATWWAHETHPADDHDAVPAAWVDGDPLMEAIAEEVWEHCPTEGTSLVVDDPRNIAATAAAVARAVASAGLVAVPPTTADERRARYAAPLFEIMRGNGWDGERTERVDREMDLVLDAVLAVADAEQAGLREERDLAIAHDRQPYPTAWAYEQACKALRRKTEAIERVRAVLETEAVVGRSALEYRGLITSALMADDAPATPVLPAGSEDTTTTQAALNEARVIARRLAAHATGFQDVLDDSDRDPWAKTVGADITALRAVLLEGAEPPLSPDYQHPACGFNWHGRDGMDIPIRDGQPVCPRCELAAVEKKLHYSEKRREELRQESRRRGKIKGEYAERIRQLEIQLDGVRSQLGAEILRAGQAEAELRRLAAETQPTAAHSCGNCEGIDPDTCWTNPDRPPEPCPAAEFGDYGQQCGKPVGHELHTFEEQQPASAAVQTDEEATPCSVPNACDPDDGPCERHEREQSHAEGDHSVCRRDECVVLRQS